MNMGGADDVGDDGDTGDIQYLGTTQRRSTNTKEDIDKRRIARSGSSRVRDKGKGVDNSAAVGSGGGPSLSSMSASESTSKSPMDDVLRGFAGFPRNSSSASASVSASVSASTSASTTTPPMDNVLRGFAGFPRASSSSNSAPPGPPPPLSRAPSSSAVNTTSTSNRDADSGEPLAKRFAAVRLNATHPNMRTTPATTPAATPPNSAAPADPLTKSSAAGASSTDAANSSLRRLPSQPEADNKPFAGGSAGSGRK